MGRAEKRSVVKERLKKKRKREKIGRERRRDTLILIISCSVRKSEKVQGEKKGGSIERRI